MKKAVLTAGGSALLLLSACGSEDVESILLDSTETMEEVESYRAEANVEQSMQMGEDAMDISTSSMMEITQSPLAFYEETTMSMMGEEEAMSYTSYFHEEDGFFMEEPVMGSWMQIPEEEMENILAAADMQMNPEQQLEQMQEYVSSVEMEETDGEYIIHLSGEELDMQELMQQFSGDMEGVDEMMDMMEEVDVQQFNYTVHIDKETKHQTAATIEMTMEMTMMDQTTTMDQTVDMTMYDFNEVEDIVVPEEVINEAVPVDETQMQDMPVDDMPDN
ncbi:DUF6612 family protein [Alkalicoccus urumqiensis]|uniref:Uncharacterized protein n=1 Tax=Alkalicoccus urumqiensis TaxID=1548213 RepID=A0A2P6MDD9_ALKUR|nr:DUF6612 family protein [Alkalicoccus urumqiensis]PRO64295.1 hypothetical protein C6I21_15605 [Alkalicoccus urumqiensis]